MSIYWYKNKGYKWEDPDVFLSDQNISKMECLFCFFFPHDRSINMEDCNLFRKDKVRKNYPYCGQRELLKVC